MTDWKNRIVGQGEEDPRKIVGNPRNWRIHPLAQGKGLEGVLGEIGWIAPVTINRTTGYCLDGHLRVALAVKRGAKSVPVQYVELSEEEEALALATLDPLGAMAETDAEKLGGLLEQIQTEDAAVQALLDAVAEKAGIEADGAVPEDPGPQVDRADELQEKWRVQRGQVWEIGKHRLMCGDSTSAMDWAALLPPREREREREREYSSRSRRRRMVWGRHTRQKESDRGSIQCGRLSSCFVSTVGSWCGSWWTCTPRGTNSLSRLWPGR